jgi:hypothetical protein
MFYVRVACDSFSGATSRRTCTPSLAMALRKCGSDRPLVVAESRGCSPPELPDALGIVTRRRALMQKAWNAHFAK